MQLPSHPSARRVIVGLDEAGASTIVSDSLSPSTTLRNGIVLDEVWQQRTLPARVDDVPSPEWTLGPSAPSQGVVVRLLTVPGANGDAAAIPDLHSDPSLHVITMLEGELDFALENGRATLRPGETIVLRDSMHDLCNSRPEAARFVYTSFPLAGSNAQP